MHICRETAQDEATLPNFNHQTYLLHPLSLRIPEDLILSRASGCVGKACPAVDTGKKRENSRIQASIPLIYQYKRLTPDRFVVFFTPIDFLLN